MKAKFIVAIPDRFGKYVDYGYEYKGETYFVRNHFSGNALGESLREQHLYEQNRIDNTVDCTVNDDNHPEGTFDLSAIDMLYEEV